ncbi:hypothetical protein L1276_002557 [Flavobacterium sp. HSC-32F16]|uniref:hypothetical protein n=1 Tax=Flavobacterium sp. HSC-32F16 TaxID=2910964 RepID=UPI0020A3A176|nr:hypothetical protein [Flavobacterium sp. HSC-32F16]MCP2027400.1 hypothetical protein [Flavobacterium sp. HSC-32F16]
MNYPQLHLPKDFLDNIDKVFLPPVKPILPVAPEKPSKLELLKILFPLILIGIFMFFAKQNTLGMLFIAPCIFLLFSNSDRKKYENDLWQYNKTSSQYPKLLSQYSYEMEILKVDSQNYQDYKRNIANERILNLAAAHFPGKDYKKGKSHDYFKSFLHRSFGEKIMESASIADSSYKPYCNGEYMPYVTDFAYIDPYINLRIDIEIDEPYDLELKKPIHLDDLQRNEFFTRNCWVVVRFAEEQAVLYPELCCQYLEKIIEGFYNAPASLKDFKHNVPEIKKWDLRTAGILISKDHRDTYLNGRVYYKL